MHYVKYFIIILIVLCILYLIGKKEHFIVRPAMDHPTKCVSCENQYPSDYAWLGMKTKCFSCVKDAYNRSCGNPMAAFNQQPLRYYEYQPNIGMGYPKAGYLA